MPNRLMLRGIILMVLAAMVGVAIALWIFRHFQIYIPLENQQVNIDLQEALQAEVKIHDALDVNVSGRVNAVIPIQENLDIPLTQTLNPQVYFDTHVPIRTTIPVRETLKINQPLAVDTQVKVRLMGKDISLPLKGTIPIALDVPIHMDVPLAQKIHLKFNAPVKTVLKENLNIPLKTTLNTLIPVQGHLNVPIQTALKASVDVKNTLPIKIEQGELNIPLNSIRLATAETAQPQTTVQMVE
ncbi:MFS transporter [Acinetobacter indicus]